MGYDEYIDNDSLVELMRGINRYNLTYEEKIELCILTISLFAEYFATSPTAEDVENMYKLLKNDIFTGGKMRIKSSILREKITNTRDGLKFVGKYDIITSRNSD